MGVAKSWVMKLRGVLRNGRFGQRDALRGENRFQRFSNSGTYRATHRMIVVCETVTPRSAIISTRSR